MVPYPQNVFFTGREEELTRLHQALTGEGIAAVTQAIQGLGGVGKTQLAVEYAHAHQHEYKAVLWSIADTRDNLQSGFVQIADKLNLPEKNEAEQDKVVQAVVRWLERSPGYLLILDNADEPSILKEFLPNRPTGRVLLTSRAYNFAALNIRTPLRLETLPEDRAVEFLLARAEREGASESEQQAAKLLAEELGGLPLALEQAATYIANEAVSFEAYLQSYRKRKLELLEEYGPEAGTHKDSVRATWSLNMQTVQKESQAAADLLNVCAFLSPERIPFEVFIKGGQELGSSLASALEGATEDSLALNRVLKPLMSYSLLQVDREEQTFSVHRLVQEVVRERLSEPEQRIWTERVVKALVVCHPGSEHTSWPACERLRTHWLACGQYIERLQVDTEEAGWLLNQTGYYLYVRAEYSEPEPLYQQALAIWQRVLGDAHPLTASIYNNLAALYVSQGRYEEAESLYQQILAFRHKVLGDEHADTALSFNNLALLYRIQGRYEEAELLLQQALAIYRTVLGDEHPDTAQSLNSLATLYHTQGRYEKTELLYRQALAMRQKVLGDDHPDTAQSLNNLAGLYKSQGWYGRAEPLFWQALAIYRKVFGDEHPDTAQILNNLAGLYYAQGRYTEAEPLYQQALAIRQKVLGDEHTDTAQSLNDLAGLYFKQGRYEKVEPLYQQALAIYRTVLGDEHPDTAQTLNNLAEMYRTQGRYEEAEPLYRQALAIRQKVLGDEHPDTAQSLNNLALLYFGQSRYEEAESPFRQALAIYRTVLGDEHPDTANSLNNLAGLLYTQGRYMDAEPLFWQALAICQKSLGDEHPTTKTIYNNLQGMQMQSKSNLA